MLQILFARLIDRKQAIILDILIDQSHNQGLTDHGSPESVIVIITRTEPFALVVVIRLDQRIVPSDQHVYQIVRLEFISNRLKHFQHQQDMLHALEAGLRMDAVVATSAVILIELLTEVV